MAKAAFDAIMAGLKDAAAHAKGRPSRARVHYVEIPDVKAIRKRLELTQSEFAERFELPLASVRNWEQERKPPTGPALTLLKIIDRDARLRAAGNKPARKG
jgi:putative transcriptional regulator